MWILHFEGERILVYIDGRGLVEKGNIAFLGESREGCTSRDKARLIPHVGKDSCAFQGEESMTPSPCGQG